MSQSPLARVPILRILLPFVAGILTANVEKSIIFSAIIFGLGIITLVALRWGVPHTPQWSMRTRSLWIIPFTFIAFALGHGNAILSSAPVITNLQALNGAYAQAQIIDITYKDNSMTILSTLQSVVDSSSQQLLEREHKILLTTKGCNYTMQPGDIICFKSKLETITGQGNPDSFDYKEHMRRQGIIYTQHLEANSILKIREDHTLLTWCNKQRRQLQQLIFNSRIQPHTQNFIVATLLGNSHFLTPETRATFATAGISHILALSGLHIAIIMAIIWFILFPLDYFGMRQIRLALTILTIIAYAVFTGLSPSVVRATIMATIALIGLLFYRKSVSLNALATAALVILTLNHEALYNPGFLLSFITVASLLLIYGQDANIARKSKQKHPFLAKFKAVIVTSLIAMASTIMLTAWYFNSISLVSVFTNIIVIPLFPIVMAISSVFMLLCGIGIEIPVLNSTVDSLYGIINSVAQFTGNIPGHIDTVYVTGVDVMLYYIALSLFFIWYYKRQFKWINFALLALTAILAHTTINHIITPNQGFVIFNDYYTTPVFSFNGSHGVLWTPDGEIDIENFKQSHRAFLAHYGIDTITTITHTEYAAINGQTIVCAQKGNWKNIATPNQKIGIDILLISKRYHKDIKQLCSIYAPKQIILSGNIYDGDIEILNNECKKTNIPTHSIKQNGAYTDIP